MYGEVPVPFSNSQLGSLHVVILQGPPGKEGRFVVATEMAERYTEEYGGYEDRRQQ